jgi:hypothetical protein
MASSNEDRIQVFARVRPLLTRERGEGQAVSASSTGSVAVATYSSAQPLEFNFDAVLSSSSTQENAFNLLQPQLVSALSGYNVTVFACVVLSPNSFRCKRVSPPF